MEQFPSVYYIYHCFSLFSGEKILNKKVLLRERKRHTDRGVSSTTSAALSWGGGGSYLGRGGVHTLDGGRGTYIAWGYVSPWPDMAGGTYIQLGGGREGKYLGWGTPHPDLAGGERYLPSTGGRGTYLGCGKGYLPWMGVPLPHPDLARGRGTYLEWGRGTYLG